MTSGLREYRACRQVRRSTGGRPARLALGSRRRVAGFTLVELLVVIGIMALTAGTIGFALRGGSPGAALQSAQATLGSLLAAARTQAALQGKEAALLVLNDPSDAAAGDRYLRAFVLGTSADEANTTFIPVGDYVLLPRGCALVPDTSPKGGLVESGVDFAGLRSSALSAVSLTTPAGTVPCLGVRFTALGAPDGAQGTLVLATVAPQPAGANPPIKFKDSTHVRGVALSAYGVVTFLNDATSFDTSSGN